MYFYILLFKSKVPRYRLQRNYFFSEYSHLQFTFYTITRNIQIEQKRSKRTTTEHLININLRN